MSRSHAAFEVDRKCSLWSLRENSPTYLFRSRNESNCLIRGQKRMALSCLNSAQGGGCCSDVHMSMMHVLDEDIVLRKHLRLMECFFPLMSQTPKPILDCSRRDLMAARISGDRCEWLGALPVRSCLCLHWTVGMLLDPGTCMATVHTICTCTVDLSQQHLLEGKIQQHTRAPDCSTDDNTIR